MDRNCSRSQIVLLHNSSAILAQNLLLILLPSFYDEALDYAPRGLSDTPSFPDAANRAGFGMGQAFLAGDALQLSLDRRLDPCRNLHGLPRPGMKACLINRVGHSLELHRTNRATG